MKNGEQLEIDVRNLLRLQGWRVTAEVLVDFKKLDALAERLSHFGRPVRTAVECKDHARPLSQREITEIYANYSPLLQNGNIDQVLVVTRTPSAPSAMAYASKARGLVLITHLDLLNGLLDFGAYVQDLISQYRADEASNYYVQPLFDAIGSDYGQHKLIQDAVLDWTANADTRPAAILGGYGMGKTTLAKRVAFLLAERHQSSSEERIPILIRLEELGVEQSLEGLLGKHFTAGPVVHNYSFGVFMELNLQGRFGNSSGRLGPFQQ